MNLPLPLLPFGFASVFVRLLNLRSCAQNKPVVVLLDHSFTFLTLEEAVRCLGPPQRPLAAAQSPATTAMTVRQRLLGILGLRPPPALEATVTASTDLNPEIVEALECRADMYSIRTVGASEGGGYDSVYFYLLDEVGAAMKSYDCDSEAEANMR